MTGTAITAARHWKNCAKGRRTHTWSPCHRDAYPCLRNVIPWHSAGLSRKSRKNATMSFSNACRRHAWEAAGSLSGNLITATCIRSASARGGGSSKLNAPYAFPMRESPVRYGNIWRRRTAVPPSSRKRPLSNMSVGTKKRSLTYRTISGMGVKCIF